MKKILVACSLALLLSGCNLVPDNIQVDEGVTLVSYDQAVTDHQAVSGKVARWGGIITGVENINDKTVIEVVEFPLNHYGKPITSKNTPGRFKAVIDGFVDPVLFEEGRRITFKGAVDAPSVGMIGEQPYLFPTLASVDYYMWSNTQQSRVMMYDVGFYHYNGWYSPFFYRNAYFGGNPYWGPGWGGAFGPWGPRVGWATFRQNHIGTPSPRPSRVKATTSSRATPSRSVDQRFNSGKDKTP